MWNRVELLLDDGNAPGPEVSLLGKGYLRPWGYVLLGLQTQAPPERHADFEKISVTAFRRSN